MSNQGNIVQVIGPVVDVDFSATGKLPKIYEALEITFQSNGEDTKLVLETQQHLGDGWVRSIAMSSSDSAVVILAVWLSSRSDRCQECANLYELLVLL
ncbi:MAG: hypothetical protein HC814_02300 [Rhodobacteraceae bacterium]|nr:hypothetical protein [Paracoccaceae bacterium]